MTPVPEKTKATRKRLTISQKLEIADLLVLQNIGMAVLNTLAD